MIVTDTNEAHSATIDLMQLWLEPVQRILPPYTVCSIKKKIVVAKCTEFSNISMWRLLNWSSPKLGKLFNPLLNWPLFKNRFHDRFALHFLTHIRTLWLAKTENNPLTNWSQELDKTIVMWEIQQQIRIGHSKEISKTGIFFIN